MTISTRIIGLFVTLALGASISLAQGPMLSNPGDDVPPDMQLPLPMSERNTPMTTQQPAYGPSTSSSASTGSYDVQNADSYDTPAGECAYPDAGGLWNEVAPIESTGTWLRRGFWYAETDALVLTRSWDRND